MRLDNGGEKGGEKGGKKSGKKGGKKTDEKAAENSDSFPEDDYKLGNSNDPPWFGFRNRTEFHLSSGKGDNEDETLPTQWKFGDMKRAKSSRYKEKEEETYLLNANV